MKRGQPLSDIAYACDYTHFARGFRKRFGTTPGAVGAGATGDDDARVAGDTPHSHRSLTQVRVTIKVFSGENVGTGQFRA